MNTAFIVRFCLWFVYLCVPKCSSQFLYSTTQQISYPIVGIFDHGVITPRLAFNESMRHARLADQQTDQNEDETATRANDLLLEPILLEPIRSDSYYVWREMCSNKDIAPIALFGPQNPISDGAIRDQCALANIPHIQATWQPLDPDQEENDPIQTETAPLDTETKPEVAFKKISINFYPPSEELSYAYAMLLKFYNWNNFAVLYEDEFGLLRIQKILAEHSTEYEITIRKLDPEGNNNKIFKELVKYQERFILDCHVDHVMKYLKDAQKLNMVNSYQHYILVSMDASILANEVGLLQSNVTWLSITEYDQLKTPQHFLATRVGKWMSTRTNQISPPVTNMKLDALIMNDVANHILMALQKVRDLEIPERNICDPEANPWPYGALLQDKILETKSNGVTGHIEFDNKGKRFNYTLHINEIKMNKRQTIGKWLSSNPEEIIEERSNTEELSIHQNSKHFIIISSNARPYFSEKIKCPEDDADCVEDDGDENYEGFAVDLVKHIFAYLRDENFNYTYSFSNDTSKKYGSYDPDQKKWVGLIGEVLDKKADLAVSDLTITEERKKVVDFSVPFMTLGISILARKEKKVTPGMFSFLNPYTFDVWIYTATAYCVVSIILFISSRISPADWQNPQPCDKDPEELENIWNFKNCTWLTMGSIMTQGCDILPKAIGTRWVCGMWWFFAVIVCQTYIAQLSASMTSALENEPINSVEDLAQQNKILYGAVESGSTFKFFESSKDKMYRRMYETMRANPAVLVKTNEEGEKRVLNGNNKYVFFMESCTIQYKVKRNCALKKVGGELDSKDYGIAMPANSPFRTHINRAILHLKESTDLDQIIKKWWEDKYDALQCEETKDDTDVEGDLEIENLIGLFVVLVVGLVFCLFVTAAEFMNEVRNIVVRDNVTYEEVFMKELKASLNFFQLQKPVLRNPNRTSSVDSGSTEKRERMSTAIENFMDIEKETQ